MPSIIVLGQNAGADRWGFDVSEKEEDAHRLIKLALLHTDQLPAGIQDSSDFESELNLIRSQCRTASSVASALIRNIFFHSLSDVAERQRKTLESLLKEFTLHVVVGVPASWQQDARVRLLEVISDAGIPGTLPTSTLELFTEPEASALVFAGEFEEMFNLVVMLPHPMSPRPDIPSVVRMATGLTKIDFSPGWRHDRHLRLGGCNCGACCSQLPSAL